MLDQVYESDVLAYELYDGSPVNFNAYLVVPPRIYMEDVWVIFTLFSTAQLSAGAENLVKLFTALNQTNFQSLELLVIWSFDGVTGALVDRRSVLSPGILGLTTASTSIAGQLYGKYNSLHIKSLDIDTLAAGGIDYPPTHFSDSGVDIVNPFAFAFDEFSDLAVLHTSDDYNTQVSIHTLSTGALVAKVYVCGMISDIAMESVGRCYVVHTNGVVSVVDYLQGKVVGVFKIPGHEQLFSSKVAWDHVYKRVLSVTRTPDAVDGASTIKIFGYANLPVATNITPPLLLRAPRTGRYVPVIVRAYGDAGEPIPAQQIEVVETGGGVLLPGADSTDELGYADFQLECATEGASEIDAETETTT